MVLNAQNYYFFTTYHNYFITTEKKTLHLQSLINKKSNNRIMILNGILAFFNLGTGEIIAIVVIVLLLFGGKKIPELMRGLGKGVKSFKQGMNEIEDEIKKPIEDLDKDKPGSRPDNPIN